jgi:hypothetical protein
MCSRPIPRLAAFVLVMAPVAVQAIVPAILDDSYGYMLPGPTNISVWWCEATYKVGRNRALPVESDAAARISAARNEYEPFQIVLRPDMPLTNVTVSVSDFIRQGNPSDIISSAHADVRYVEYVEVLNATDSFGAAGWWPDPLPKIDNEVILPPPWVISGGTNQPYWITVYVPKGTPAGEYDATATFAADGIASFDVPVVLHVYNFTLSDVTHTDTAYELYPDKWRHNVSTLADQRAVWDLYMQNFRDHRVFPHDPHALHQITWQLVGSDFIVNFDAFDQAMERYIDEFGFGTFSIINRGNPWFPPDTLGGYALGTPEYQALLNKLMGKIAAHLREKGWMDRSYFYRYDEPSLASLPTVLTGLGAMREAAPELRRLVTIIGTVNPSSGLSGLVDIYVPVASRSNNSVYPDRQEAGDEYWWYVAGGPIAPYANYFLDHPAIAHRIRFWSAEKMGITGDLYWSCNYWSYHNPWIDTLTPAPPNNASNGDGYLLYHPARVQTPPVPMIVPFVDSIRWELVREALEDAEYFWLLKELMEQKRMVLGPDHPAVIDAQAAYDTAMALVPNLTQYSQNVDLLYQARTAMALAIEGLDDGFPFLVRAPRSKAVEPGGTVKLYSEALGWPEPYYQWRQDGVDIPGETNSVLVLTNCGPAQAGAYTVTASNSEGEATSDAAFVNGYWSEIPAILSHPVGMTQYEAETAVMSVTAVSTHPLAYQWLVDGQPVVDAVTNNAALLLTNLTASMSWIGDQRRGPVDGAVESAHRSVCQRRRRLEIPCGEY